MRARGIASVALGAIVLSAAPPSVALGASQIAQSDSTDPAIEGSTVTYTTTIANGESDSRMVSLSVLLIKAETDGAVDNPLLSATASQGSCAIETPETYFGYWHLSCDLGILGPGATATVTDTARVNYSMSRLADGDLCLLETPGTVCDRVFDAEDTTVIHPPEIAGSPKLKFSGLPATCATDDFTIKVKSKAAGVRNLSAQFAGPFNEYGSRAIGGADFPPTEKQKGSKLRLKVPVHEFQASFYRVAVLALRGGAPKLKASVTFEVCNGVGPLGRRSWDPAGGG